VGRLSHEVGWKYKDVVRTLENKRRARAILEVQKRNKLKVINTSKIWSYFTFFPKIFLYINIRDLLSIKFCLQKLTKQAGESVAKATAPYTAIINNFGYN